MERIRFITHAGRQVLLIDHSGSNPEEIVRTLAEVETVIRNQPAHSLLVLCDFGGVTFDKKAADLMKVVATKDRPYVLRSAFVHAEEIPDVYYRALQSFSAREFPNFKSREEALDWLVSEEQRSAAS